MAEDLAALIREAEQVAKALERLDAKERRPSKVPPKFIEFCAWVGVQLTLAQRIIGLCAYDGVEPRDLDGQEREMARALFGDKEAFTADERRVIVAVCGARGGKTYVIESLRLLHLSLTVPLPMLAPGEVASCPVIEPDKDLAQQALNYIRGAIKQRRELLAMVCNPKELEPGGETIDIQRPDGARVEIVCRAASAKGRTGRGRSLVAAGLGEAAFFRDANYKVNDEEVYRALLPRVVVGGQIIINSTPFSQNGLLHDLFVANHPDPLVAGLVRPAECKGTALAIHAPTLTLRDNDLNLASVVASEYSRDAENADREFGAKFMAAGSTAFFDADSLNLSINYSLQLPLLPEPGVTTSAGGDTGFEKNSSVLAIAHRIDRKYRLAELYERKPKLGEPLKPSEVVRDFANVMARHKCRWFMADGHYRATVLEHLEAHYIEGKKKAEEEHRPAPERITFVDAPSVPSEAFVRVLSLMREGLVEMPNHERLVRQLRETMKRPKPGGGFTIVLPKWPTGEHGDLAAAYVLAVYQAYGFEIPAPPPAHGTKEWEEREADKRRAAAKKSAEKKWWKR